MAHNKILVIGSTGQVGRSFKKLFGETRSVFFADLSPKDTQDLSCDLTNDDSIKDLVGKVKPTVIINCAAYTAVDQAEKEESLATLINGHAVETLAKEAAKCGAILIHYSTDYVFDGTGEEPWTEDSMTNPVNAYGRSKLAGELAVIKLCSKGYVFRTQWVYNHDGKNFLNTMLRLGSEKEELSVVGDQVGAPTSSDVIARYTLKALTKITSGSMPKGIYNLVCRGEISWHGFAVEIFKIAQLNGFDLKVKRVNKILSQDYPTLARRPKNSRLNVQKLEAILGEKIPAWNDALLDVIEERSNRVRRLNLN